jgi:hypothetical protein
MEKIIHTLSQQTYNHQMPPKIISKIIHHFGFCSSGCLFFDADRLFRAVASPYFVDVIFD